MFEQRQEGLQYLFSNSMIKRSLDAIQKWLSSADWDYSGSDRTAIMSSEIERVKNIRTG